MKIFELNKIARYIIKNLDELKSTSKSKNNGKNDFALGEITAYAEILELLQSLDKDNSLALNFNIEDRYPLK